MADQYDQDVAAFLNNTGRVLADHFIGIKQALLVARPYYADNLASIVAGWADSDRILDGSETDGRLTLTKAEWDFIAAFMVTYDNAVAGDTLSALVKFSTNPKNPIGG